jgi:hypothetical protein
MCSSVLDLATVSKSNSRGDVLTVLPGEGITRAYQIIVERFCHVAGIGRAQKKMDVSITMAVKPRAINRPLRRRSATILPSTPGPPAQDLC